MLLEIDLTSTIALYQQIRDQIVYGIGSGRLVPGELLPTVRQLAEDLGINAMTVNKAYTLLKQEGMIVTDRRQGTRVTENPAQSRLPSDYRMRLSLLLAEGAAKSADPAQFRAEVLRILAELQGGGQ